nr:hypothetical protein BaRGS_033608 [Batillaria attramentaria]
MHLENMSILDKLNDDDEILEVAKTSKSTQVTYEEIKAETGWKKPAPKLHKRKKYVNPDGSQDPFHDRGDCRRNYGSRADHVLEWMQRAARADHMHPERQSTQDTLDSGIENESPSYNSFVSGHRRIHRRPYPWSIDLDPSLIRGSNSSLTHSDSFPTHRRIARRSYPWEIELDPRLVRGSSSSISTDGTPEDRFQLTLGVIEAAVHRTVNRILSGSSVSSAGTRTHLEPSFSNKGGGSFSDSELNYNNAASSEKRKKARSKKIETGADGSFSQNTGSFRSLALLSNDLTIMRVQSQSPDIAETKSDAEKERRRTRPDSVQLMDPDSRTDKLEPKIIFR